MGDAKRDFVGRTRDAIVFLVQDVNDKRLNSMMIHALDSPTTETRGIAVTVLSGDNRLMDTFIVNGWMDEKRVNTAVRPFRRRSAKSQRRFGR
jgi:hypothetical protein